MSQELINRGLQVQNEDQKGANTSDRVGSLFVDIVKEKDADKAYLESQIANATTNFKGYFPTSAELGAAYPQATNKKDWFAWVGSPYPGTVCKVAADGSPWFNTGEVPPVEEIDLGEYAKAGGTSKTLQDVDDEAIRANIEITDLNNTIFNPTYSEPINFALADAAISKSTGGSYALSNYKRTSIYAYNIVGKELAYTGEIDNDNVCGVAFYDAAKVFLGYQFGKGVYAKAKISPPNGATLATFGGKGEFEIQNIISHPIFASRDEVIRPTSEEIVWSYRTNFPTLEWMKRFVVSLKLYTQTFDTTKNIAIQNLRVDNIGGRTFLTIGVIDDINGNTPNVTTTQIALYDNPNWVEPIEQNGHKYETIALVERNSSGVIGSMLVDWSVVPRTSSEYDYFSVYPVLNTLLSKNVWSNTPIQYTGAIDITSTIEGVQARLITSRGYNVNDEPDNLIIYCHGNGQSTASGIPSPTALAWFKEHKISFAVIKIQDEVTPTFTTRALGWGNDIAYTRIVKLYEYLMANFNFHKSAVIVGGSMGGLTMGEIAYKRPFPISFCLGIGSVPRLKNMWNVVARKPAIRAAYGMTKDGSDDANFDIITKGFDWYDMGMLSINAEKVKVGFPNVYLYYGNDATFVTEFGGVPQYEEIRDALLKSGIHSVVGTDGSTAHASPTLYDYAISQGVFEKELGIK